MVLYARRDADQWLDATGELRLEGETDCSPATAGNGSICNGRCVYARTLHMGYSMGPPYIRQAPFAAPGRSRRTMSGRSERFNG